MKAFPAPQRRLALALIGAACAAGMFASTGCSPKQKSTLRASAAIEGGKLVVAGARPRFPASVSPTTGGFLETTRWDESIRTLQIKGWAPFDVRNDAVRFVLRDPHDRLLVTGAPIFAPQPRPDVAAAHPDRSELLHAGFTASIRLTNLPDLPDWTDTLELYCLDATGALLRLTRVDAPARHSWDRRPDRFEIVLMYAEPVVAVSETTQGSLDVCEPGPAAGTVRLAGWAPFDGQSPQSVLVVELAPSVAPASIVTCVWVPRPDVRAAVDPARADLDRCGFEVLLGINGSIDDLRRPGALRLWSIDAGQNVVPVGLAALRAKR